MHRLRACIYCRNKLKASSLTAEPVLPTSLGGQLALKSAACPDCAARIRVPTDDFLSIRFAPTVEAMAARRHRGGRPEPPVDRISAPPSADDWRRAHRAAAKILYCYLLLELGQSALSSPPSELLRRHLIDDEAELCAPRWEVTAPRQSPSPRWHVLMFDSARPAAAIGLFGTIWFRFHLDLAALAPHGRLVAFDAFKGARGMAMLRSRTGWRYRSAVRWGWKV